MPIASGGTISTSGSDTIHTFTSSGTFSNQGTGITNVRVLVVGGGGAGGGNNNAGGGGAGGIAYNASLSITEASHAVVVARLRVSI